MAILDDLAQVAFHEVREVRGWRPHATGQDPEGHVEVRPSDGPVHHLRLIDGRQQRRSCGEPSVVLDESRLALDTAVLHADAHRRPRAVEALGGEALEDLVVNVVDVWWSPISIAGVHQESARL